MTPTAYIVTPISTPPEKDGHYQMACENGVPVGYSFEFADGEWIQNSPKIWFWLRPVDLSRMLEDCWKACEKRAKYLENRQRSLLNVVSNEVPDKEKYLQSVLNPPK